MPFNDSDLDPYSHSYSYPDSESESESESDSLNAMIEVLKSYKKLFADLGLGCAGSAGLHYDCSRDNEKPLTWIILQDSVHGTVVISRKQLIDEIDAWLRKQHLDASSIKTTLPASDCARVDGKSTVTTKYCFSPQILTSLKLKQKEMAKPVTAEVGTETMVYRFFKEGSEIDLNEKEQGYSKGLLN